MATRAAPFESLNVGDVGDIAINTFNLQKSIDIITKNFRSKIDLVHLLLKEGRDELINHYITPI
jgi:guanidinobutyrase